MEDRLTELERRMGVWEVTRKRAQRRGNFWFSILTAVVIASPFLVTPDEEVPPTAAHVVGMPRLRFGRLWRAVSRTHRPRPAAPGAHNKSRHSPSITRGNAEAGSAYR
jgi:hypothetical protein